MNKEKIAFFELLAAGFIFSFTSVFTRLISNNMGVYFQMFLRVCMMVPMFFILGYFSKIFKKIDPSDLPLLFFRGLLITIDFSCFYIAITNLSLGLALFIYEAANIITTYIFGAVFFKEKLTPIKTISLVVALSGLYIIYIGSFGNFKILPLAAALIAGTCFGLNMSSSKKLTSKYDSIHVSLIAYLVPLILCLPLMAFFKEQFPATISPLTILELFGFSIVLVSAFCLTLNGYKKIEAQKASLILLSEMLFIIINGIVIYHEIPTVNTIVGGILILLAFVLPNLKKSTNSSATIQT